MINYLLVLGFTTILSFDDRSDVDPGGPNFRKIERNTSKSIWTEPTYLISVYIRSLFWNRCLLIS